MTHDQRGMGRTLLSGVTVLRGFFGLLQSTIVMALGGAVGGGAGLLVMLVGVALLLFSIVQLVAAAGLWKGSSTGWMLATAVYSFDAFVGVILVTAGAAGGGTVAILAVDALALLYLLASRSQFGSSRNREEMVPDFH